MYEILKRLEQCRLDGSDDYETRMLARLIKWLTENFLIVYILRMRRSLFFFDSRANFNFMAIERDKKVEKKNFT